MKHRVLNPNDKLLRSICSQLSKKTLRLNKTQEMIEEMLDYVYGTNNKGPERDRNHSMTVGLSGNQIGITKQISVVDLAIGRKNLSDIYVLINPHILWKSTATVSRIEGCVNLPHIWGEVIRSKRIKVSAMDRSGNEFVLTLSGWPATLLQHEIDHLNGILFIDHLKDPQKAHLVKDSDYLAYKKNKKEWKTYVDVSEMVKKVA